MGRFCCEWLSSVSRKLLCIPGAIVAPTSGSRGDILIEQNSESDVESGHGISFLSLGKIKYLKGGGGGLLGSSRIGCGIPIIDPQIGHGDHHHHQRQLFSSSSSSSAKTTLVNNKNGNIFHWQQQNHQWISTTPPSSIDLEWEHEGLAPPTADECVRKDDWDEEEEEEEDELECDTQEEDESKGEVYERVEGRTSRNDSAIHRTPSPSSICHSLEWDSDDFIGHSQNQSLHHYGRLLYPS